MKKTIKKIDLIGFIVPLALLLLWYVIPIFTNMPKYMVPSLNDIFKNLIDFIFGCYNLSAYSGMLFEHLSISVIRVLCGFFVATVLGLLFGYMAGCCRTFYKLFNPIINFLRTIPGIAWLPISIVWFGIGGIQSVFLISLASFFPVYTNTCHGVTTISESSIAVSKVFGATALQKFRYVIFPMSLNDVCVGLRVGLGLSWAYLVLGEMTGCNLGIGAVMQDARMMGQTQIIIVCMLIIALTAIIFDRIMSCIIKLLFSKKYYN